MTDAIAVEKVSKYYSIWRDPAARLKHPLLDLFSRTFPPIRPWLEKPLKGMMSQFHALEDISFTVGKGECLGILGRNGSGKSTLLRIIAGVLQPTAGRVSVQGRIAALLELGSGFNPEFTGRQNVYLNAAILGLTREETDERFDNIARFADIGSFLDQPVKTYSSGMAVRLAFAVSVAIDPEILIVDEALAVGDEAFQRKCFARLEKLRDAGSTVLFVSHGASTIVQLCDRAVLLHKGRLILSGTPKLVVGRYQRLIYAPPERTAELLQEIQELQANPAACQQEEVETGGKTALSLPAGPREEEFDPHLVSNSAFEYNARGAKILEAWIENSAGERVNVLVRGQPYFICNRFRVERDLSGVRFGNMFKTIAGFELGGILSHAPGGGFELHGGEVVKVSLPFEARLLPGTYFSNVGVVVQVPGEEEYFLHRLIDGLVFRISAETDRTRAGIVDFEARGQKVRMQVEGETSSVSEVNVEPRPAGVLAAIGPAEQSSEDE